MAHCRARWNGIFKHPEATDSFKMHKEESVAETKESQGGGADWGGGLAGGQGGPWLMNAVGKAQELESGFAPSACVTCAE